MPSISTCLLPRRTCRNSNKMDSMLSGSESCGKASSPKRTSSTTLIYRNSATLSTLQETPESTHSWNSTKRSYQHHSAESVFPHGSFTKTTDTKRFHSQLKGKNTPSAMTGFLTNITANAITPALIFTLTTALRDLTSFTARIHIFSRRWRKHGKR